MDQDQQLELVEDVLEVLHKYLEESRDYREACVGRVRAECLEDFARHLSEVAASAWV